MVNKNKNAKARRESVAEKLKNLSSTAAKSATATTQERTVSADNVDRSTFISEVKPLAQLLIKPAAPSAAAAAAAAAAAPEFDVLARAEARANRAAGHSIFLTPAELKARQQEKQRELKRAEQQQQQQNPLLAAASAHSRAAAASAAPASAARKKQEELQKQKQQEAISSKKRKKREQRPTIQQLKEAAKRPDLVELHDVNAPDPHFLLELKQMRNTVPVPLHWAQKSSFLSHTVDRDAGSSVEATVMPRWIESMDIAGAWKTKQGINPRKLILPFVAGHPQPELTGYGDLFHEGRDMRARIQGFRPGQLSDRLRSALGMGPSPTEPPPWTTGMQRVGRLPPSYPNIKIPGVNAPIPSGARYGPAAREWGEPPRDPKNPSDFLYETVMRSAAAKQEAAERKAVNARWGGGSVTAIPLEGAIAGGAAADDANRDALMRKHLPSCFTLPKAEADEQARKEKARKEEEARILMAANAPVLDQAALMRAAATGAAPSSHHHHHHHHHHQVPLHVLQQAGIVVGRPGGPAAAAAGGAIPGQFGVEVNQMQLGGMHALLHSKK